MNEHRKLYLVKYALTSGIKEVKAKGGIKDSDSYVEIRGHYTSYRIGRDIFFEKESAIAKAEEMRIKKLKSLDKQIKKYSALKFE